MKTNFLKNGNLVVWIVWITVVVFVGSVSIYGFRCYKNWTYGLLQKEVQIKTDESLYQMAQLETSKRRVAQLEKENRLLLEQRIQNKPLVVVEETKVVTSPAPVQEVPTAPIVPTLAGNPTSAYFSTVEGKSRVPHFNDAWIPKAWGWPPKGMPYNKVLGFYCPDGRPMEGVIPHPDLVIIDAETGRHFKPFEVFSKNFPEVAEKLLKEKGRLANR